MTASSQSAQLSLSQSALWNLLNAMPDPVVVKDRSHQWVAFNDAFCQLMGYQRDQLEQQSDADYFAAVDVERMRAAGEAALTTGITQQDYISFADQGDSTILTVQSFLFAGEAGALYLAQCLRPVAAQQMDTEAALRYSTATSRALIEAIPDLLIRMRGDGTYLNLSFDGDFKPTAIAAAVGKTLYDCLPTAAAELRRQYVQKALETGELQVYDQELVIDGRLVYEEVRLIPSGDDEVLTMIRDVTDQRRAEIELQRLNEQLETQVEARTATLRKVVSRLEQEIGDRKQAKAQLQEKEEFLRTIYDSIEHQIFVVEVTPKQQFRYAGWNRYTEKIMGIASEAAVGKSPTDLFPAEEAQAILDKYIHCLQVDTSVVYEESLTFQEEIRWSITTLNPLKDETGQVYRIVGTAIDISDRKRAELALQESETQLRQQTEALKQTLQELQNTQMQLVQSEKMSSLGQLVAGVAHEINNPVNFIFGNLKHAGDYTQDLLNLIHLYQKYYPQPVSEIQQEAEAIDLEFLMDDLPKLLHSMKVGADRIQKIVASLRTFSRMDEAEMKAVSLPECLDSTLMILQNRIKAKPDRPKIEIIKQYANLPLIECYAGQLNQVFMNILSNAIDALEERMLQATPPQNETLSLTALTCKIPPPTITIRIQPSQPGWVQIAIADNGSGIPDEVQSRIFDPFFTTKPIGQGTGMGLSISYQIITEKHRGMLSCHSTPETGTEFTIDIPVHQTSA
ncbi:MAG: PAS domain-containing protein [Leptolyngbyaceae cyanobacterium bins.349]|nr:PAS domain-containing protein [Leptolyngbyaceae cyanobacterium bins.349]